MLQDQWAIDDSGNWRADVTFIDTPPMACVVYAQTVPAAGGGYAVGKHGARGLRVAVPADPQLSVADDRKPTTFSRSYTEERFQRMDMGIDRFAWDAPATSRRPRIPSSATHPENRRQQPVRQPGVHDAHHGSYA